MSLQVYIIKICLKKYEKAYYLTECSLNIQCFAIIIYAVV